VHQVGNQYIDTRVLSVESSKSIYYTIYFVIVSKFCFIYTDC